MESSILKGGFENTDAKTIVFSFAGQVCWNHYFLSLWIPYILIPSSAHSHNLQGQYTY